MKLYPMIFPGFNMFQHLTWTSCMSTGWLEGKIDSKLQPARLGKRHVLSMPWSICFGNMGLVLVICCSLWETPFGGGLLLGLPPPSRGWRTWWGMCPCMHSSTGQLAKTGEIPKKMVIVWSSRLRKMRSLTFKLWGILQKFHSRNTHPSGWTTNNCPSGWTTMSHTSVTSCGMRLYVCDSYAVTQIHCSPFLYVYFCKKNLILCKLLATYVPSTFSWKNHHVFGSKLETNGPKNFK